MSTFRIPQQSQHDQQTVLFDLLQVLVVVLRRDHRSRKHEHRKDALQAEDLHKAITAGGQETRLLLVAYEQIVQHLQCTESQSFLALLVLIAQQDVHQFDTLAFEEQPPVLVAIEQRRAQTTEQILDVLVLTRAFRFVFLVELGEKEED